MHAGRDPNDLLAPSLRKIIESPHISKLGVSIFSADFRRLRIYFNLKPQGALELSHLHKLVTAKDPANLSPGFTALASQVKEHLGLPLSKGKVRTSDWSGPLSPAQMSYAATDAYAALMLYHCLNAKRVAMQPVPPLPVHAEIYPALKVEGQRTFLRLGTVTQHVSVVDFYGADAAHQNHGRREKTHHADQAPAPARPSLVTTAGGGLAVERSVFRRLLAHQRVVASKTKVPPSSVVADAALRAIAHELPRTSDDLHTIKGVSPRQIDLYGKRWVKIVKKVVRKIGTAQSGQAAEPAHPVQLATPKRRGLASRDQRTKKDVPTARILHTSMSSSVDNTSKNPGHYSLDNTNIGSGHVGGGPPDESAALGSPLRSPSQTSRKRKRKRQPRKSAPDCEATTEVTPPRMSLWKKAATLLFNPTRPERSLWTPPGQGTKLDPFTLDSSPDSSSVAQPSQLPSRPATSLTAPPAPPPQNKAPAATKSTSPRKARPAAVVALPSAIKTLIFRKKLLAFNRRVTSAVLLPHDTIDSIVRNPPTTVEELVRIPGVMPFANACARQDKSFLRFIQRAAPKQPTA